MPYIISASEKTRKSASETETKALLYLMNFDEHSSQIHYYIIDVINDLSGHSVDMINSWDVQSKGNKSPSPKTIGKEIVTLFKNFMSEFNFMKSILFLGGVSSTFRIDESINIFGIENVKSSSKTKMIEGLKEEAAEKEYIEGEWITDENIDIFLDQLTFVIDDKGKTEYVRGIISLKTSVIVNDEILISIFDSIRDVQSAKKNNMNVEGKSLNSLTDILRFKRHMTSDEIRIMALNRIVNTNIMDKGMPICLNEVIGHLSKNDLKDVVEDCKLNISKALFDKNNSDNFWDLFGEIYTLITDNPQGTIEKIFILINKNKINCVHHLDEMAIKYLVALIMEVII
ncbi:MAG: hypothetical protein IKC22_07005 [Bacilli bacterium]|nr:hypothetical protein [Bacilli bacterium]